MDIFINMRVTCSGSRDSAEMRWEIYAEVRDNTNNGIVWLEVWINFSRRHKLPAMQTCQSLVGKR